MAYQGDVAISSTIDFEFTTISQGVPFTLAGSPVISAYPDNSLTQLTAGITLNADWDGVTGLNHVRVVASVANGYASGSNYTLVITTGTVNGISVVGYCVGSFSIEARSDLRPTTAGRTLAVDASGRTDLGLWVGNAPDALSSGKVPADIKLWLTSAPDALSSGKMPADLKLWLATAPLALSSQQVQAIVSAYASGQAPLQPTVSGRTLDVSAGGEAGLDWANIGSPTTTVGLTGTTISSSQIVASVTAAVAVTSNIKKNQALSGFEFVMFSSTDHVTPQTGLTVTAQRSINGAAFGACTSAPTEIGATGHYTIDLSAADLNGNSIDFKFTATGADQTACTIVTVP